MRWLLISRTIFNHQNLYSNSCSLQGIIVLKNSGRSKITLITRKLIEFCWFRLIAMVNEMRHRPVQIPSYIVCNHFQFLIVIFDQNPIQISRSWWYHGFSETERKFVLPVRRIQLEFLFQFGVPSFSVLRDYFICETLIVARFVGFF